VEHAIEMAGTVSNGTKESILAGVFERMGISSEVDSGEEEEEEEEGASVHEDQREIMTPTIPLHRGVYAPFVRLPPTLGPSKAPNIYEGYQRTSASISLEPEDPLLPMDIDEEALAAELRQEEELDAQDHIVAEQNENVLWGEYSRRVTRGEMAGGVKRERGYALRFKPPDGHVKSQAFVVDSDSE
jgi:hypothetical protein